MKRVGNEKGGESIIAERRIEAFELRKSGYSYREIAQRLGVSRNTAHKDVNKVLEKLSKIAIKQAGQLREIEHERLNSYLTRLEWKIKVGDYKAIEIAIKISERISKLYGLDIAKLEAGGTENNLWQINIQIVGNGDEKNKKINSFTEIDLDDFDDGNGNGNGEPIKSLPPT